MNAVFTYKKGDHVIFNSKWYCDGSKSKVNYEAVDYVSARGVVAADQKSLKDNVMVTLDKWEGKENVTMGINSKFLYIDVRHKEESKRLTAVVRKALRSVMPKGSRTETTNFPSVHIYDSESGKANYSRQICVDISPGKFTYNPKEYKYYLTFVIAWFYRKAWRWEYARAMRPEANTYEEIEKYVKDFVTGYYKRFCERRPTKRAQLDIIKKEGW
jgi:hypothetical protein